MAVNTQAPATYRDHAIAQSIAFLVWIRSTTKAALKALKMARMLSALSNMSDYQLAQIGISRSEISEYAEKLMADE